MDQHFGPDHIHRFEPDRRVAQRDNRMTSVVAVGATALFLYFGRSERDPWTLALFAGLAGVLTYLYYGWQARRGMSTIEITAQGIEVAQRGDAWRLGWTEIKRADHGFYGGERWTFRLRDGGVRVVRLEGFTPAELTSIRDLIRARVGASAPPEHARID